MIVVIKTTVTVFDPRMGKHQCVTMRTKGFFFFFEEMSVFQKVCVYQGNWKKKEKKTSCRTKPPSGTGPMSNYLKI